MNSWSLEKKLNSDDGLLSVELRMNRDGTLFRYYVNHWIANAEEDRLFYHDEGYWSCTEMSGYFATLSECENAARESVKRQLS